MQIHGQAPVIEVTVAASASSKTSVIKPRHRADFSPGQPWPSSALMLLPWEIIIAPIKKGGTIKLLALLVGQDTVARQPIELFF